MKTLLALCCCLPLLVSAESSYVKEQGETWLVNGKQYKNVHVIDVSTDTVRVTYFLEPSLVVNYTTTGVTNLPISSLPLNLQKRFGHTEQAAKEVEAKRKMQAEEAKREEATPTKYGNVLQISHPGILMIIRHSTPIYDSTPRGYVLSSRVHETPPEIIFLTGHPRLNDFVDGDSVRVRCRADGKHQYTDTAGAMRTVRKYAFIEDLDASAKK